MGGHGTDTISPGGGCKHSIFSIPTCGICTLALPFGMKKTPHLLRLLSLLLAFQVLAAQAGAGLSFFYCPHCVALRFSPNCPQESKSCCATVKACCHKTAGNGIQAEPQKCCVKIQLPVTDGSLWLSSDMPPSQQHWIIGHLTAGADFVLTSRFTHSFFGGPAPPRPDYNSSGRRVLLQSSTLLI